MKVKTGIAAGFAVLLAVAPVAKAALVVTDGDFESSTVWTTNVVNWFDSSPTVNFWEGSWPADVNPNGSVGVVFSSFLSDDYGAPSTNNNLGAWIYQSLGTADGLTALELSLDWGGPTDDPGGRELGLTVGVYAYDGLGGFAPADNADVLGAAGVTLLDAVTFTMTSSAGGGFVTETPTLDLTGAGSQEVFLRVNGFLNGTTESWPMVDNVQIIPEPATIGLVSVFGAGALFIRRRFKI